MRNPINSTAAWLLGKGGELNRIAVAWESLKDFIADHLHATHAELHILVGLIGYCLAAWLFRWRFGALKAMMPIAALEVVNEMVDCLRYGTSGWPWRPVLVGSMLDIIATLGPILALLTVLLGARKLRVKLSSPAVVPAPSTDADDGDSGRTARG